MTGPIIVGTDFRARADRAIDRALMLGAQWASPVTMVHALDSKEAEIFDLAGLDRQMRAVLPPGMADSSQVDFAYPEGSAPQALAQTAVARGARLVVLAPARLNSLRDFLLGSMVDYSLRHCERPVLIVKQRPHHQYRRIVVATDYSPPSAHALALALDWFPEAEVHIVHGCHIGFDSWQKADYVREEIMRNCEENMAAFLASLAQNAQKVATCMTHVRPGSGIEMVNTVARERDADLLVVGSHGESGFRHATIGSTASGLLETSPVDTLMVKSRAG